MQRERSRRRPDRRAPEHAVLRLQQAAGNTAVTKLLRNGTTKTASPPQGGVDVAALAASLNDGVIKQRLRTSPDATNQSLRGGRWIGTVGGVEYALYELDDVLFTHDQAERIETAIREAGEHEWPSGTVDPEALWRTVVQLTREGVPAADLLSMLQIYAFGPTLGDWGRAWLYEALGRLPQPPTRRAKPEPQPQPRAEIEAPAEKPKKTVLSPAGQHLHRELLQRFAALTATSLEPMDAMKQLDATIAELAKRRRAHARHVRADFVSGELQTLQEAIELLRGLSASIMSLFVAGRFEKLLAFNTDDIGKAIEAANQAETAVADALKEQDEIAGEIEAAKGYKKPEEPETPVTVVKKKGGTDGIWDPGFTESELATWMTDKVDRAMNASRVGTCAREVVKHGGTAVDSTFDNRPVYHKSSGKKNSTTGCTVFFTVAADDVVTIVGIGWHVNPTSYKLDWKVASWTAGSIWINKNTIRLD